MGLIQYIFPMTCWWLFCDLFVGFLGNMEDDLSCTQNVWGLDCEQNFYSVKIPIMLTTDG